MILVLLCATSLAQESAPTEVVVYEDAFARWDDTRWQVELELLTPLGTSLSVDANRGLTSYVFQVRAIIACAKEARLGRKQFEVACLIEDFALQATTYRHSGTPAAREAAQGVLEDLDAMLTGAAIQLQVDAAGGVNDVDIEGLTASNERERLARESLRQVVARLTSGFHLEIPDQAQRDGQFLERNSGLMAMPSLTGSQGSTLLVHDVKPWNGQRLVQTAGEGMVSVEVAAPRMERLRQVDGAPSGPKGRRPTLADTIGVSGGFKAIPNAPPPDELVQPLPLIKNREDGGVLTLPMTYALTASGVGLFDPTTGVLTERVWTVVGLPTASSGDGITGTLPYRAVGRLRLLGPTEASDLGPTRQVTLDPRADSLAPLQPMTLE